MALSVPLSRFTSRVGGGSAFYVRLLGARFMRTRMITWIAATSVLCLVSFFVGRLSGLHDVITYSVSRFPRSINRAEPSYGLDRLQIYTPILIQLREGNTTNVIEALDGMAVGEIEDAMYRRPFLDDRLRGSIDRDIADFCRYRERFPRRIDYPTNYYVPGTIERMQKVEDFIRDFPKQ